MLIRLCVLIISLFITNVTVAKAYLIQLGDETVTILDEYKKPGPTYIHLHQDEMTALKAARTVVKTTGGHIITLKHHGGRNIKFHLKGRLYEFDPNRIFTQTGIKKTLNEYGNYSQEAHRTVDHLARKIKSLLPAKGKVIAIHNNKSYSLKNYYPGKSLALEAQAIYSNPSLSYRNFYVVTQKEDYIRLKQLKYNSVLQTPKPKDDGSLSVYLAAQTYINVEAAHHQLKQQITMLKIV